MAAQDTAHFTALVLRVLEGDEHAPAELIDATQARLFKFCLLLCRNREVAEDVCQETLIKALLNIKSLKNPDTFWGWIYRIARNIYTDIKRKPGSKDENLEDVSAHAGGSADLDTVMNIQKILAKFEPDERLLLLLVELEGCSYKEAGDVLELSEDAVRSKLHRLRVAFIKKYNAGEDA
jgi:RNA polymerase sigma-70 factor (ECF subfamily)